MVNVRENHWLPRWWSKIAGFEIAAITLGTYIFLRGSLEDAPDRLLRHEMVHVEQCKELGLRKSIVHYYFASKAALIHEVQSFTYQKYLDQLKRALQPEQAGGAPRGMTALNSLWEAIQGNKTGTGLSIEVWSASRRDSEIKRRASALQRDARKLLAEKLPEVLGGTPGGSAKLETLSALILATVNGLAVSEYLEGEDVDVKEAYDLFLQCLRAGVDGSK